MSGLPSGSALPGPPEMDHGTPLDPWPWRGGETPLLRDLAALPGEGRHGLRGCWKRWEIDWGEIKADVTVAVTGLPTTLVPFSRDQRWARGWHHPGEGWWMQESCPQLSCPSGMLSSHLAAQGHSQDAGTKGTSQQETTISPWHHAPGLLWGGHDTIRATLSCLHSTTDPPHVHHCGTSCPWCPSVMILCMDLPQPLAGVEGSVEGSLPSAAKKEAAGVSGGWCLGSSLPPPLPPGCWLRVALPRPLFREDKAWA